MFRVEGPPALRADYSAFRGSGYPDPRALNGQRLLPYVDFRCGALDGSKCWTFRLDRINGLGSRVLDLGFKGFGLQGLRVQYPKSLALILSNPVLSPLNPEIPQLP